ncbi:MAG: glycine betaine ABC transporter substrate-binding protein, partial [Planctomycetota bacterium]|jgi:osmoprotectant transport system permease protein
VRKAILRDGEKVYAFVSEESDKRFDVTWLKPLGFNNAYALMMRQDHAGSKNIKTISDLKDYVDRL